MQLSSVTVVYDQISTAVSSFLKKYVDGNYLTKKDMLEDFNKYLRDIYDSSNSPLTKLDLFNLGEPLSSSKMNKFINSVREDINICAKQLDFLNAKTVSIFNLFTEEIEGEKKYCERILSKTKILQMYSSSSSNDMVYFGDSFENADYIDIAKMKVNLNPTINGGSISLRIKETPNIWKANKITINKSNGFIGNNNLAIRKKTSTVNSAVDIGNYEYSFLNSPSTSLASSIVDGNPASHFIYEAILIDKATKADRGKNEFCYIVDDSSIVEAPMKSLVDWASHEISEPLVLDVVLESAASEKANSIMIRPYFESSKMVKIKNIYITDFSGKTEDVLAGEHYIGLSMNNLTKEAFNNYSLNFATFQFNERRVKECRVVMVQDYSQKEQILHTYWKTNYDSSNSDSSPFYGTERFNPDYLNKDFQNTVTYDKSKIIPMLTNPNVFKKNNILSKSISVNVQAVSKQNVSQIKNDTFNVPIKIAREVLQVDRMSIGIRDISLAYQEYEPAAEIISKPYNFDSPVEAVMLDINSNAAEMIDNGGYIESSISVDGGNKWISISPVQSGYSYGKTNKFSIPEVLCFNQNVSNGFKLPGVQYLNYPSTTIRSVSYEIPNQVKNILVKINITKGTGQVSPLVYSYKLAAKVKPT